MSAQGEPAGEDHSHYRAMRERGADPLHVFLEGRRRGLAAIARIRMLRAVFGLGLEDAKRIHNYVDSGRCDGRWDEDAVDAALDAWEAGMAGDEGGHEDGYDRSGIGERAGIGKGSTRHMGDSHDEDKTPGIDLPSEGIRRFIESRLGRSIAGERGDCASYADLDARGRDDIRAIGAGEDGSPIYAILYARYRVREVAALAVAMNLCNSILRDDTV